SERSGSLKARRMPGLSCYPRRSLQGVVVELVEDAGVLVQRGGLGGRPRIVHAAAGERPRAVDRDEDPLTLGRRVRSLRVVGSTGREVQLVSHELAREVDRRVGRLLLGGLESLLGEQRDRLLAGVNAELADE